MEKTRSERRVGTFTLGIVMVFYSIMFILHMFFDGLKYHIIFRLWPIVLLLLGCEILYYAIKYKDAKFRYDFAAIVMIMLLLFFSMGMAGADWLYEHAEQLINL